MTFSTHDPGIPVNVGTLGSNFSISFEYSTSECNGVLVRGEDGTSPGDYVTLELQDGTVS